VSIDIEELRNSLIFYNVHFLVAVLILILSLRLALVKNKSNILFVFTICIAASTGTLIFLYKESFELTYFYFHLIVFAFSLLLLIVKKYDLLVVSLTVLFFSGLYLKNSKLENKYSESAYLGVQQNNQGLQKILDNKCVECHASKNLINDSIVNSYDKKNESTARNSRTFKMFSVALHPEMGYSSEDFHVKIIRKNLQDAEVKIVRDWLSRFNKTMPTKMTVEKPQRPIVPNTISKYYKINNEVDSFLFAKINSSIQKNMNEISRKKVIKSLIYLLRGLPPSGKDVDLVNLPLEGVVDRLLQDERYGITMASRWLKMMSFAEEMGFIFSDEIPGAEIFKVKLIKDLNQDIGWNKINIANSKGIISGGRKISMFDFMPKHVNPIESADFAIYITNKMMLNVDMRCARCHDHKILPISKADYYTQLKLFDIFASPGIYDKAKHLNIKQSESSNEFLSFYQGSKNDVNFWIKKGESGPLTYMKWLVDKDYGVGFFASRVFVNNLWGWVFGTTLVDLDKMSEGEVSQFEHEKLLDWLTYYFQDNNYSIKKLLKKILTSTAYQFDLKQNKKEFDTFKYRRVTRHAPDVLLDSIYFLTNRLKEKDCKASGAVDNYLSEDIKTCRSIYYKWPRVERTALMNELGFADTYSPILLDELRYSSRQLAFILSRNFILKAAKEIAQKYLSNNLQCPELLNKIYQDIIFLDVNELVFDNFAKKIDCKKIEDIEDFITSLLISSDFLYRE
jgi:hypothetical protein